MEIRSSAATNRFTLMNWSAALPRGKVQLNPLTELACSGINSLGKERHTKVCTAFRSNFEVLIQSEKHRVVYEPGEKWITVFYFARSLGRPHASPTQIVSLTTLENEAAISTWVWPHLNEAAISTWVWPHLRMKLPFLSAMPDPGHANPRCYPKQAPLHNHVYTPGCLCNFTWTHTTP